MLFLTARSCQWLVVLCACIYCQANAQGSLTPKPRQEPYIKDTNSFFGYYEYLPIGYDTDSIALFPLIIYLSGLESVGDGINDLDVLLKNGVAKVIKEGRHFPSLVMIPQSIGGFWNPERVNDYLDFIEKNYRVDKKRIYITGISAGGSGTFSYAVLFPERMAAVVPISGRGNNLDMCNMTDVPIWAFHNANDSVFSHVSSIIPIDNLNNCDPAPFPPGKITIYPDGGHDAWTKTYDGSGMGTEDTLYDAFDMDVFDWMFQIAKDTVIAEAGKDQIIFHPHNNLLIHGYGASPDGEHTYAWTQMEGPDINIVDPDSSVLVANDVSLGVYMFVLTVTDNFDNVTTDTIQVTVRPPNAPPVVDAGEDQLILLPVDSVFLTTATATDPENDALSFEWVQEAGPAEAVLAFEGTQLILKNLEEGEYTFRFTATDDFDSAGTDIIQLKVITPMPDVGVVEIQKSDSSGVPFMAAENITIVIKNFGNIPQSNFEVGYQLDDGTSVLEIITEEIAPDSSLTFTFNATADMSLLQNYTLRAFTLLSQDEGVENDTSLVNLNWLPTVSDFPYAESFEQIAGATWLAYGENSSWEVGELMKNTMDTASDGTSAWVTGLQEDYHANEFSFLLSPIFDFSALTTDPTLTYDAWQITEPEDSTRLCFTTDGGATWQSFPLIDENSLPTQHAGWMTVTHTLAGLAGQSSVLFRIEFKADSAKNNEGVAFDHVFICTALPGISTIPDTLVAAGETVSIPFSVEGDPSVFTFFATSGNQELIPDENITVEDQSLMITLPEEVEGETDITVFAHNQCVNEVSFTISIEKITATKKAVADTQVKVYPNPSPGQYQIALKHRIKTATLYNQEGKLMEDFTIQSHHRNDYLIDITHYPKGLYFLKIETTKGLSVHKLIKD